MQLRFGRVASSRPNPRGRARIRFPRGDDFDHHWHGYSLEQWGLWIQPIFATYWLDPQSVAAWSVADQEQPFDALGSAAP